MSTRSVEVVDVTVPAIKTATVNFDGLISSHPDYGRLDAEVSAYAGQMEEEGLEGAELDYAVDEMDEETFAPLIIACEEAVEKFAEENEYDAVFDETGDILYLRTGMNRDAAQAVSGYAKDITKSVSKTLKPLEIKKKEQEQKQEQKKSPAGKNKTGAATGNYKEQSKAGAAAMDAGNYRIAIEHFEAALEVKPDSSVTHYNLGICYEESGDAAAATLHYKKYLELEPDADDRDDVLAWIEDLTAKPKLYADEQRSGPETVEKRETAEVYEDEPEAEYSDSHKRPVPQENEDDSLIVAVLDYNRLLESHPGYDEAQLKLDIFIDRQRSEVKKSLEKKYGSLDDLSEETMEKLKPMIEEGLVSYKQKIDAEGQKLFADIYSGCNNAIVKAMQREGYHVALNTDGRIIYDSTGSYGAEAPDLLEYAYDATDEVLSTMVLEETLRLQRAENVKKLKQSGVTIVDAAASGDVSLVQGFLESGADIKQQDSKGRTPLHVAAWLGHAEVVKFLLENKADINSKEKETGSTPLMLAVINKKYDTARLIIENKAQLNAATVDGWTALHFAADNNDVEMTKLLLANNADVAIKNNKGEFPISIASGKKYSEVQQHLDTRNIFNKLIKKLKYTEKDLPGSKSEYLALSDEAFDALENGEYKKAMELYVKMFSFDPYDANNIFNMAVCLEEIKLYEPALAYYKSYLLLDPNSDIKADAEDAVEYLRDTMAKEEAIELRKEGKDLVYAAMNGNKALARLLIKSGANLYATDQNGNTPLHLAAFSGSTDVAQVLIDAGVDVDIKLNKQGQLPYTPLLWALRKGHAETAKALLKNGADINMRDGEGRHGIHLAAQYGNVETVKLCLEKKVPINILRDNQSEPGTPLIYAALGNNLDNVKYLIEKGASYKQLPQNYTGFGLIDFATRNGNLDMIKYFASKGLSANSDYLVLYAAYSGNIDVMDYYLNKGLNINLAGNSTGRNTVYYAAENNKQSMALYLMSKGAQPCKVCNDGSTTLHMAAYNGDAKLVKLLLDLGCSPYTTSTGKCKDATDCANKSGKQEVINYVADAKRRNPPPVAAAPPPPPKKKKKFGLGSVVAAAGAVYLGSQGQEFVEPATKILETVVSIEAGSDKAAMVSQAFQEGMVDYHKQVQKTEAENARVRKIWDDYNTQQQAAIQKQIDEVAERNRQYQLAQAQKEQEAKQKQLAAQQQREADQKQREQQVAAAAAEKKKQQQQKPEMVNLGWAPTVNPIATFQNPGVAIASSNNSKKPVESISNKNTFARGELDPTLPKGDLMPEQNKNKKKEEPPPATSGQPGGTAPSSSKPPASTGGSAPVSTPPSSPPAGGSSGGSRFEREYEPAKTVPLDKGNLLKIVVDPTYIEIHSPTILVTTCYWENGMTDDCASQVSWSSSNNSVATIFYGHVDPQKKNGKTTITASWKGKSAKCDVTVDYCGNIFCEKEIGETPKTCPADCRESCNYNGRCEEHLSETYKDCTDCTNECVQVVEQKWANRCASVDEPEVKVQNTCNFRIDVNICFREEGGSLYKCEDYHTIPLDEGEKSDNKYPCKTDDPKWTGEYLIRACHNDSGWRCPIVGHESSSIKRSVPKPVEYE